MLPILFPKDEICSLFSRTTLCTLRLLHGVPERPEVPVRQSHHLATMHSARQYGKENGTVVTTDLSACTSCVRSCALTSKGLQTNMIRLHITKRAS